MEIDFRHELMQSYLNKIVEACKEKKILEATIYGLASQIAEMMNVRLSRFENKGLKVLRSDECVRYWLISAEAKTNIVWRDNIHVVFNLVCSPTDIVGKRKLTKKEKEIVAELLEIWDKNLKRGYFGNKEEYLLLSEKLSTLTHRLICHEEINFCFNIDRFYEKEDLLSMSFNLGGLSDLRHVEITTNKLVDIDRLFQDEKGNV
jgi:hypothetical protein